MPDSPTDFVPVTVYDPRLIIPRIVPGARITSTSRTSTDPLSVRNPRSPHINNPNAFDMAPIKGMSYPDFIKLMADKGYTITGARDEVNDPVPWATGPHWHGIISGGPPEPTDWVDATPKAPAASSATPGVTTGGLDPTANPGPDMSDPLTVRLIDEQTKSMQPKPPSVLGSSINNAADMSGLSTLLSMPQKAIDAVSGAADYLWQGSPQDKATADLLGVHMRPSELIGGMAEAFPLGGVEVGGLGAATGASTAGLARAAPDFTAYKSTLEDMVRSGSSLDEINAFADKSGMLPISGAQVDAVRKYLKDNPDYKGFANVIGEKPPELAKPAPETVAPEAAPPEASKTAPEAPTGPVASDLPLGKVEGPNGPVDVPVDPQTGASAAETPTATIAPETVTTPEAPPPVIHSIDSTALPLLESAPAGKPVSGDEVPTTPVDRLMAALRSAEKLRPDQIAARAAEMSDRVKAQLAARGGLSGEASLAAEKSALSGALPSAKFEPVEDQFTPQDIQGLLDQVRDSPLLSPLDSVSARDGLRKLLSGSVPTPAETEKLSRVFGPEVTKEMLRRRGAMSKLFDTVSSAANIPRTLMSSYDVSIPGRQGIFIVGRPEFWDSFKKQFNALGSERAYEGIMDNLKTLPYYDDAIADGVFLGQHSGPLSAREEFAMSNIVDNVPGIRASSRAANAFLNNARIGLYDSIRREWAEMGADVTLRDRQALAKYINTATGRGGLWKFEEAAPLLNATFFSPRLIASRLTLMNPYYYMKLPPLVRQQALRDLLSFGSVTSSLVGLAAIAGAKIETDPRSADFAKIRVSNPGGIKGALYALPSIAGVGVQTYKGETRYDMFGGWQQFARLSAQLASNSTKTGSGNVYNLRDAPFGRENGWDISTRFARSKLSPIIGYIIDAHTGKNIAGEKFSLGTNTMKLFTPMWLGDLADAYTSRSQSGGGVISSGPMGKPAPEPTDWASIDPIDLENDSEDDK